MADYVVTIPDDINQRVLDAICAAHDYDPASGLTQSEFVRSVMLGMMKGIVVDYEAKKAWLDAAQQAEDARAKAESEIVII